MKTQALQHLFVETKRTLLRFPFVILSGLCAAIVFALASETRFENNNLIFLILVFTLGLPLFLTLDFFMEGKSIDKPATRGLIYSLGILFLIGHYFSLRNDDTSNMYLRCVHISLSLHLLVSFAAYLGVEGTQNFWQLNKIIFLRILFSFIYAAVLYIGITLALLTTTKLFSFSVEEKIYIQMWGFAAFVFQTWHFLAGLPKNLHQIEVSYPRGLKIFVQYLLIPLVSLYMVILYLYMGKIVISREWPKGYVGWLVTIIAVLGVFNILLIEPEKGKLDSRWIKSYSNAFYVLMLPLLVMLFVAVGLRIGDYGMTEMRYFILALGLWLTCLCIYFIFSNTKNIKIIPISLFVLFTLTLWGPWSAFEISKKSQLKRAQKILEKYKILVNEKIVPATTKINYQDEVELTSIFNYLIQRHTAKSLSIWLSQATIDQMYYSPDTAGHYYFSRNQNADKLMKELGLTYRTDVSNADGIENFYLYGNGNKVLSIKGYSYFLQIDSTTEQIEIDGEKFTLRFIDGGLDVLSGEKILLEMDLKPYAQKIVEAAGEQLRSGVYQLEDHPIDFSFGKFQAVIVPSKISGQLKNGKANSIEIEGSLLIK